LALPLLAGIILGAMGPEALDAQTNTPPAYLIAEIQVNNADAFKEYASQAPAIIASFGGRYLVAGGKTEVIEGAPPAGRVVVIEFPSLEKALQYENSPAYLKIRPIRRTNATSRLFIVEGKAPTK
jgi:uncharacterized protein (DUF1330 family)